MTALFGDSIDYMEYKTGRRAEAITFAAQTFCSKIIGAINTGVTTVLFILGPIVGSILNIIPLLFIKYSNSLKNKVELELKSRREAAVETDSEKAEETV